MFSKLHSRSVDTQACHGKPYKKCG